ncbi:MAG TPA: hypothetical protein VM925_04570 [Labilithrix sp.]|nr:hypothetical protein [Labilithrix sp.]
MKARTIATTMTVAAAIPVLGSTFAACVEPPPKIAAIPSSGLALRLFVFGASAQEARQAFEAAKQNNKNFTLVKEGGDGEVVVGLENDSPKCVAPTALCSFKLAFRVRDNQGNVVHVSTTTASANAEKCSDLCDRALNAAVVKVIEASAAALKSSSTDGDGGAASSSDGGEPIEAGSPDASAAAAPAASSKPAKKVVAKNASSKPEPAKAEPAMCVVGHGPTLPAEEAEKRAAQVEALKRIGVLDQDDYDCLRKAYLDRL